ncbi:uncharacterized mitochondrial protein AtMg00810-like [Ricinus communis]|uniref:uncharacterized mitochondrial protein AtMg00810-like n=1 Tax=Ricinus communis TaxID=3988 RepID=UPI00201AAF8B|nr:uncharacterized mitochondrial protein AtMg00810-like [Ricinus communis]
MEVTRSKKGIVVSQWKYILDLLKETRMSGCKPSETPIEANSRLGDVKNGVPIDIGRYQRLAGKLIYLSHTRSDIAFTGSLVSQFMHSPYEEHLEAVYQILHYLKSSIIDRRSTSGYCTFVWGNLVTWRSKKHNVVARSSAEA